MDGAAVRGAGEEAPPVDAGDDAAGGVLLPFRLDADRSQEAEREGIVSVQADVPEILLVAMRRFIERHPNWDQYRLVQAALAGFLVQNGIQNRGITRCYLANLFPGQGSFRQAA